MQRRPPPYLVWFKKFLEPSHPRLLGFCFLTGGRECGGGGSSSWPHGATCQHQEVSSSVADPERFDADPDPIFQADADQAPDAD